MKKIFQILIAALSCIGAELAHAAIVQYNFNTEFSGAQAPAGTTPWIVATFDDQGTSGDVLLTISASGLSGGENISAIYFNFDPALNVNALNFSHLSGVTATSIEQRENSFRADGDGRYDMRLSYPTGSGFNAGMTSVYNLAGPNTLTANSFFFLSAPAGGHGPFHAAAHIQNTTGIGSGGSGWIAPVITTPIPPTLLLFISGIMTIFSRARRLIATPV